MMNVLLKIICFFDIKKRVINVEAKTKPPKIWNIFYQDLQNTNHV